MSELEAKDRGQTSGDVSGADELQVPVADDESHALVDLVNRLLDRGVVIRGEVTISVAGVDLVYLGLNAVVTSVATARRQLGRPVGKGDI